MSLSVTKWGVLKYLSAEISSETTKISDFKTTNKMGKNRKKWSKFGVWQRPKVTAIEEAKDLNTLKCWRPYKLFKMSWDWFKWAWPYQEAQIYCPEFKREVNKGSENFRVWRRIYIWRFWRRPWDCSEDGYALQQTTVSG